MSGHVEESETANTLQLYVTSRCTSVSTWLLLFQYSELPVFFHSLTFSKGWFDNGFELQLNNQTLTLWYKQLSLETCSCCATYENKITKCHFEPFYLTFSLNIVIKVHVFFYSGVISGARTTDYLLEKSRIVRQVSIHLSELSFVKW